MQDFGASSSTMVGAYEVEYSTDCFDYVVF